VLGFISFIIEFSPDLGGAVLAPVSAATRYSYSYQHTTQTQHNFKQRYQQTWTALQYYLQHHLNYKTN
jgi:hypothetical protein